MFSEYVILHTPPHTTAEPQNDRNVLSMEKMTQTSEGIWQVSYAGTRLYYFKRKKHTFSVEHPHER